MKKLFILSVLSVLISLTISSCNDKLDLIGDFEETAIVYGLLDKSDTVHYVKITRAFISPNTSSLVTAMNPDSSYFNAVDARVEERIDGTLTRTFYLNDTIISGKDTNGVFYAPDQKLYVFYTNSAAPLISGYETGQNVEYKFIANINNGEFTVTGVTEVVGGVSAPQFNSLYYSYSFIKSNQIDYKTLAINLENVGNSSIVNATLDIDFEEYIGANYTVKTLNWRIGEAEVSPGTSYNFSAYGKTFFDQMKAACTDDPNIDKRRMQGITLHITAGSNDLYSYMLVNKPSSSIAQNKPDFTNLSTSDDRKVIGIFASRYTFKRYHPFVDPIQQGIRCLDNPSTEHLCEGPDYYMLKFCSQHSLDIANGESFICN